jgi:putative hemolysin
MKISPIEKKISANLVSLRDKPVSRILVPPKEIIALPHDMTLEKAVDIYKQSRYTRYPVFHANPDMVVGVFHVNDIVSFWNGCAQSPVVEYCRLPHFVYEHRSVLEALMDLQASGTSLGIVIDEFGAVTGLVTMDAILGTIIGDFSDEFRTDRDKRIWFEKKSDRESIVHGRIGLDDFSREFGIAIREPDAATLAGFIIKQLDHIPRPGEEVVYKNLKFTVLACTKRTVTKVKVEKM